MGWLNRIDRAVIGICFCFGSAATVEAQYFHLQVDVPCPTALPIYSHHDWRCDFVRIAIQPPPIYLASPPLVFAPVVPPRLPQRSNVAEPGQIENFARPAAAAVENDPPANEPAEQVVDAGPFDELAEIRRRVSVLKRSTPTGRDRADRLISSGDASFAEQTYARAVALYRDAIARAPDYAEPHFRLAHAYVATRRYNLALKSAMTALELAGTTRRDRFSLAELYQGNKFARQRHDEMLLDASLREPQDGGLRFLIGFTAHYSSQPLVARRHFREAMQFPGAHQAYVRQFLPVVPVSDPDEFVVGAN